jgi:hypothetical protein
MLNLMKKIYSKILMFFAAFIFVFSANAQTANVDVVMNASNFGSEIGWFILDDAGAVVACEDAFVTGDLVTTAVSVPADVDNTIWGYDSFGDGWNGSTVDVQVAGASVIGGPQTFVGAADPNAGNNSGDAAICPNPPTALSVNLGTFNVAAPACEIMVPADLVVNADVSVEIAGVSCAADLTLDLATLSADCATEVVVCETFVEATQTTFNQDATGDLLDTPFDVPGVAAVDPAVGTVEITMTFTGDYGATTENAIILDEAGTQIIDYNGAGTDCITESVVYDMPVADYNTFAADGTLSFTILEDQAVDVQGTQP